MMDLGEDDTTQEQENWRPAFQRLAPRLLLFARQWLVNPADAEDAVQEAFVRFWRRECRVNTGNQGLLFAAVRSTALDLLRKENRRQRREQAAYLDEMPGSGPAEPAFFEGIGGLPDGGGQLEAAMRELPVEQREVLVLRIWGELTFAEVAVSLAILPNTAASRYRYALASLKKTLQPAC